VFLSAVSKVQETDNGKAVVYFAVVISLQDSPSSSSSSSAAAAASSPSPSSTDRTLAWVVSRQPQDFLALHQQLLKVTSLIFMLSFFGVLFRRQF